MKKTCYILAIVAAGLLALQTAQAQEFPIAVGSDSTFCGGAVYGGADGLVAVQGDSTTQYSINVQLLAAGGVLVGPRISLGDVGVPPGAMPLFDGTNYFLIWLEFNGTLVGQFLSTSGTLVGSSFPIATGVATERTKPIGFAKSDTTFLVAFLKTDGYLWGQRVGKSGSLVGSQVQISSNLARDFSIAFDGTNYLLVWVEVIPESDKDIFGQFVSKEGTLVGSNFVIDNGPNLSDNPTSLCCDGSRYLLAYHEAPTIGSRWTMTGRFISTSGTIGETIIICDSTKTPGFASAGFDGTNYLVSWLQQSDTSMMGQFYTTAGVAIDAPFVIFGPLGKKMPYGGVGFGGGLYLAVTTRVDSNFTDGDVWGRFISPLTAVEEKSDPAPGEFALFQNYPNPFNPSTTVSYQIPTDARVVLRVYDVLGREVQTLVNEHQSAGTHSARFDAAGLPSGIYLCTLEAGAYRETRKLLFLK